VNAVRRALWITAGIALGGCRDGAPPPPPHDRATAAPTVTAAVDHVDPHELPEGVESAFGLPIPRAMDVEQRFPDSVRARGDLPLDAVANYVRARVIADRVETGPAKTVFSEVTLKAAPNRLLRVEVVRLADRTELLVRDVTRPPATDVVKPTDPWDRPGFDPKDRKADPSRFE
jgi:hypothetical protein